jgi:hypothetical protein
MYKEGHLTFDEFLAALSEIDNNLGAPSGAHSHNSRHSNGNTVSIDSKIVAFIQLLEDYRSKCEDERNYQEAKKAHMKI